MRSIGRRKRKGAGSSAALAAAFAALAWTGGAAAASESAEIEILPAGEALFEAEGEPTLVPAEGEVVVVGRVTDTRFSVASIDRIAVTAADGRHVPLLVDGESLFVEFDGRIGAPLRLAFRVRASEAEPGAADFKLVWGADVRAANATMPRFVLAPARRSQYREFRAILPVRSDYTKDVLVIADSTAEYHFLWYLLPMAVLVLVLTVRKIRARDPVDAAGS